MKTSNKSILAVLFCLSTATAVFSHCEIPCGIYDDELRANLIEEHIGTIEKSMKQINTLSRAKTVNYNQLVRWVSNKDAHADKIQEIAYQYFMAQRIKPVDVKDTKAYEKYTRELTLMHEIIVYAMTCKQTTDLADAAKIRNSLEKFRSSYFEDKHKK